MTTQHTDAVREYATRLDATEKRLLYQIATLANGDGVCGPSVKSLAAAIGRTPRQTRRLIACLEQRGYLTVERGGGRGRASEYRIQPADFWGVEGGAMPPPAHGEPSDERTTIGGHGEMDDEPEPTPGTQEWIDEWSGYLGSLWHDDMAQPLSPLIAAEIRDWIATYGPDETLTAIKIAIRRDVRTASYVAGILRNRANDSAPRGFPQTALNRGAEWGVRAVVSELLRRISALERENAALRAGRG